MENQQQIPPQCKKFRNNLWLCTDGNSYDIKKRTRGLSSSNTEYLRLSTGDLVHRAIYSLFKGKIPSKFHINHINGVKTDNCIENLEAVTASQNRQHSITQLGNSRYGGFVTDKKKLAYEQVIEISSFIHNTNLSFIEIAKKYDVSSTAIGYINSGKNYKWLVGEMFNDYPIRSRVK